MLSVCTFNFFT